MPPPAPLSQSVKSMGVHQGNTPAPLQRGAKSESYEDVAWASCDHSVHHSGEQRGRRPN